MEMDGKKATGNDRITKDDYGKSLTKNLEDLIGRMKGMSYQPKPVREVLIPKDGNHKTFRPLGIGNFEDKLVQKMTSHILESIYEPMFLGCSYGFRPGRGCHDAIRDLQSYLFKQPITTVIDIDLENFFGTIRREIVDSLLRERIQDNRFLRYIQRLFKAGILSKGELRVSDEGVPQGSPVSPTLANVVAHYVIDEWFEGTVKAHCLGKVALFRYCDDMVICCGFESDAIRVHKALGLRLEKFGLRLNAEKTKLVRFSKLQAIQKKQETFDFLGFNFYLAQSRNGRFHLPKLKTCSKRFCSKLKRVKEWIRSMRNSVRLPVIWQIFTAKIRGHINYYAVSFNLEGVSQFVNQAVKIVFKWLNRHGGKRNLSWEKFLRFVAANPLPVIKVYHPLFSVQPTRKI